ncbi:MAG: RNA chaperone Hfq [Vulcanimicrobiaceae bacterium]
MPIPSGGPNAGLRANLQDAYLSEVLRQGIAVTLYLMNGFQLRGTVVGYDAFTIVLEYEHRPHLVYKHAVSTISPQSPLTLPPQVQAPRPDAAS